MHVLFSSSSSSSITLFRRSSSSIKTMSCSSALLLPSVSLHKISFNQSNSFHSSSSSSSFSGFRNGVIRSFNSNKNLNKSRVFMSVSSVGSKTTTTTTTTGVDDGLFLDYKPTTAFLFPGQGAQVVGMGSEAQNVQAASDLYEKANEILGFNLLDVCLNGPKEKLDSTVLSQLIAIFGGHDFEQKIISFDTGVGINSSIPTSHSVRNFVVWTGGGLRKYWVPAISAYGRAIDNYLETIYVTSLAAVELLRAREGGQQIIDSVDVTCGLSLGEYTALAFAGAFSFEDGLKLVKLRGEAMQEAADSAKSAMVSIIGLDSEKVQLLCDAANEEVDEENKVQIANFLCPGNYAVSGGLKGVEAVEAKAKSFKARMAVRLAVAGAFHTKFMNPAVSRLEAALAATEFRTPRIPVISNVDAQPHADPDTIRNILARQVTSPVQWETTVKTLLTKGLGKSFELGPGKVIAGIVKRMDKTASLENVNA